MYCTREQTERTILADIVSILQLLGERRPIPPGRCGQKANWSNGPRETALGHRPAHLHRAV